METAPPIARNMGEDIEMMAMDMMRVMYPKMMLWMALWSS